MNRTFGWTAFVGYGLVIAYLSLAPSPEGPVVVNDKLAHLLAYGGFALLAAVLGLQAKQYLLTCILIVVYSGLMEIGQYFVPGREMSALDLLANTIGVFLGFVLSRYGLARLGAHRTG